MRWRTNGGQNGARVERSPSTRSARPSTPTVQLRNDRYERRSLGPFRRSSLSGERRGSQAGHRCRATAEPYFRDSASPGPGLRIRGTSPVSDPRRLWTTTFRDGPLPSGPRPTAALEWRRPARVLGRSAEALRWRLPDMAKARATMLAAAPGAFHRRCRRRGLTAFEVGAKRGVIDICAEPMSAHKRDTGRLMGCFWSEVYDPPLAPNLCWLARRHCAGAPVSSDPGARRRYRGVTRHAP